MIAIFLAVFCLSMMLAAFFLGRTIKNKWIRVPVQIIGMLASVGVMSLVASLLGASKEASANTGGLLLPLGIPLVMLVQMILNSQDEKKNTRIEHQLAKASWAGGLLALGLSALFIKATPLAPFASVITIFVSLICGIYAVVLARRNHVKKVMLPAGIGTVMNIAILSVVSLIAYDAFYKYVPTTQSFVESMNKTLPQKINSDTLLERLTSTEKSVTITYKLVNYSKADLSIENLADLAKKDIYSHACANDSIIQLLKNNVVFTYTYKDKEDENVYSLAVREGTCNLNNKNLISANSY